jgi:hypothetical protein
MHVHRLNINIKEGRLKTNKKVSRVSPLKWKGVCGDQTTCVSLRLFWCLLRQMPEEPSMTSSTGRIKNGHHHLPVDYLFSLLVSTQEWFQQT